MSVVTHKRLTPKASKRNEFSSKVRERIRAHFDGLCGECGALGTQIHHVMPRGRGGRGVFTNGLLVCHRCHERAHRDNDFMKKWQRRFEDLYGPDYWKDEWDKE